MLAVGPENKYMQNNFLKRQNPIVLNQDEKERLQNIFFFYGKAWATGFVTGLNSTLKKRVKTKKLLV